MSQPGFTVITLSYDKREYVFEAVESILKQTFTDFEYLIIDSSVKYKDEIWSKIATYNDSRIKMVYEPVTDEQRKEKQITSVLQNKYADKVQGKYCIWLCDDDYFYPQCLEAHYKMHEMYNDMRTFYHGEMLYYVAKKQFLGYRYSNEVFDRLNSPDCKIDGGVVSYRPECLQQIEQPWFPEGFETKKHADGIFLTKLANKFKIYPIPQILGVHRLTPIGTWDAHF